MEWSELNGFSFLYVDFKGKKGKDFFETALSTSEEVKRKADKSVRIILDLRELSIGFSEYTYMRDLGKLVQSKICKSSVIVSGSLNSPMIKAYKAFTRSKAKHVNSYVDALKHVCSK